MNEFTKISIHNHFSPGIADCTKDKKRDFKSSFDLQGAYSMIDEAAQCGFQLLGQTNSNDFNAAAFVLMSKYCSLKGITLVPGVEVNLQNWNRTDRVIHVVLLFDPASNPFILQETLRSLYKENALIEDQKKPERTDCFFLTIEQLSGLATLSRSIICIHGKKQENRSLYENPELADSLASVSRFLPVATEDNKVFHKATLVELLKDFLSEEHNEWLSSAANITSADRISFCKVESPTYIWAGNTFDDLFYSVLIGSKRVLREEDVMNRIAYIARIEIDGNSAMGESNITCSHGINAIIGPSGSGKTLLLDLLKRKLTGEPLLDSTSHLSEYSSLCELDKVHLYDADGEEITDQSGYKVVELENLYQKIIKAYSSDDSAILEDLGLKVDSGRFVTELNKFEAELNAFLANDRMIQELSAAIESKLALVKDAARFVEANSTEREEIISYTKDARIDGDLIKSEQEYRSLTQDSETAAKAFETIWGIAEKHRFSQELIDAVEDLKKGFDEELMASKRKISAKTKELKLSSGIKRFVFDAVQKYNNVMSAQSAQVVEKKQSIVDNLQIIARDCLDLQKCRLIRKPPSLDKSIVEKSLELSSSSDSARLNITKINLRLEDADSVKDAFPGAVGNRPKVNKSKFNPPYDLASKEDVASLIEVFHSENFGGILSLNLPMESLLEYEIQIKTESGRFAPIEELSAGMLSKAYVSNFLDRAIDDSGSSTVILFDQPESNMEKAFLRTVLADKFNDLRRTHQLFIATHEPLLVVNADSNEIILASNDKKVGQENHVSYSNRSFVGARGRSELVEEIADLIDGGSKAVKQRSDIYEGMKA